MRFMRCLFCVGLGLTMLIMFGGSCHGQNGDLKVSISLEENRIVEHQPVVFEVTVRNESAWEAELHPYDPNRLPDTILNIRFESPLALPPAEPATNDFGYPETRIRPAESVS